MEFLGRVLVEQLEHGQNWICHAIVGGERGERIRPLFDGEPINLICAGALANHRSILRVAQLIHDRLTRFTVKTTVDFLIHKQLRVIADVEHSLFAVFGILKDEFTPS